MPFIVATYVYASSQGQRTHSARTNTNQSNDHVDHKQCECNPIIETSHNMVQTVLHTPVIPLSHLLVLHKTLPTDYYSEDDKTLYPSHE